MHVRKKRGLTSKASYVRLVISSSRWPLLVLSDQLVSALDGISSDQMLAGDD
jgi:hypothetical protein